MLFISFKKDDNKIFIKNYNKSYLVVELKLQNIHVKYNTYNFYRNLICSFRYYYNESSSYYSKSFYVDNNSFSYCKIYKHFPLQKKMLNIKIIIYDILFYSFFIYNKYYTIGYTIGYTKNYNIKSINSKKLFNCRDLYKIYSYI